MFDRYCKLSGQELMLSGEYARQAYMRELAKGRGDHFHEDRTLKLEDVLSGGEQERLNQHFGYTSDGQIEDPRISRCGLDGAYFTNIDQNNTHVSSGRFIPTLTKHSKVLSLPVAGHMKIATPLESLIFMGENCSLAPNVGDRYPCLFQEVLNDDKIPGNKLRELAGNAMHMISIGQFMMYCFSTLEVIEDSHSGESAEQ